MIEALEEPPFLLVLRDVQEELEYHDAVPHKVPREGGDVLVAGFPEGLAVLARREFVRVE